MFSALSNTIKPASHIAALVQMWPSHVTVIKDALAPVGETDREELFVQGSKESNNKFAIHKQENCLWGQ